MGGLPCAKEIIDNRRALEAQLAKAGAAMDKALGCMEASILLNAGDTQPTPDMVDAFRQKTDVLASEFRRHAEALAKLAGDVEAYVGSGGSYAST